MGTLGREKHMTKCCETEYTKGQNHIHKKVTPTHNLQQSVQEANLLPAVDSLQSRTTMFSHQPRKPHSNPCDNQQQMARPWLITDTFPNFCPISNLGSTGTKTIFTPTQSHRMPPWKEWSISSSSRPIASNQAHLKPCLSPS